MERRSGVGLVRRRGPVREDLRELLRHRWVQAVLLVSAGGSLATAATSREPAPELAVLPAQSAVIAPAKVNALQEAWRTRAVERESQRLAGEFARKGYRISPQLAADIQAAALEHDIEPRIAFGLVRAESSFRNGATSYAGAIGLTQLMPRTAAWIEPGTTRRDLRNQRKNLSVGFKYLRYLLDYYEGDTRLALLAYNRGPGTVDRLLRRGRNPDNGYVEMVLGE